MSPDDERAMLADLLALYTKHPPGPEWEAAITEAERRVPVGLVDQQRAAMAEAPKLERALADAVIRVEGRREDWWQRHRPAKDAWRAATIHAGVVRSLAQHRCGHASRFDRPLVCHLAARLITCTPCLPKFKALIKAQDRRVANGTDRQCDWCLTEISENVFHTQIVRVGQVVVHGDACPSCNARFTDQAA
jgi:hypothetical protein